tara:strand:- start:1409 stop:1954 length:546 start_codon:yes stop_codon:yes gene_type:complete
MAIKNSREILNTKQIDIILERLCHELIENHNDFSNTVLVSLMPRGKYVGKNIHKKLEKIINKEINYGELDSSFYRDDLRKHSQPIIPYKMSMNLTVDEKNVVIIDDVLFTGRSVRSAIDALMPFGRPKTIELLVLINRRLTRELPIEPNYVGKEVDSIDSEKVIVNTDNKKNINSILILKS